MEGTEIWSDDDKVKTRPMDFSSPHGDVENSASQRDEQGDKRDLNILNTMTELNLNQKMIAIMSS